MLTSNAQQRQRLRYNVCQCLCAPCGRHSTCDITSVFALQSLQGELDRLMQQRQLLSQELTDARQQHAKATNAAQQEKLQHQHQMAKVRCYLLLDFLRADNERCCQN